MHGLRIILLVSALAAACAAGADTVTVKREAYVKGPMVYLGDIATIEGENAGALADIEVMNAAAPGASKRINAALIEARLRGAGYEAPQVRLTGAPYVQARTLHLDVTRGMIEEALREHIRDTMPWDVDAAMVEVVSSTGDFQVSDGDVSIEWRPNPQYDYLGPGTFRGAILVDGEVEETFYGKANVEAYDDVVVAMRPIQRGDRITRSNVRLDKRELASLRHGAFFSLDDVAGHVARSTIQPGQEITERKIELPRLVKRNQIIPVETRIGGLTIRGRARALSDAAAGDVVNCLNLSSKEEFVGVLRPDGVLQVD